jgi:hypothetical protein
MRKRIQQLDTTPQRRSFFRQLFSGIAGGWMVGNLLPHTMQRKTFVQQNDHIQVTINPMAVSRTAKEAKLHGE